MTTSGDRDMTLNTYPPSAFRREQTLIALEVRCYTEAFVRRKFVFEVITLFPSHLFAITDRL